MKLTCYSYRNAVTGFTRLARSAGIKPAPLPTAPRMSSTLPMVTASLGATP
jgi:hypothetical protein